MSIFSSVFNEHAVPALTEMFGSSVMQWESGDELVTAIQLSTSQSFSNARFQAIDVTKDSKSGLRNVQTAVLWVPITAKAFAQDEKILIFFTDGTHEEFTVSASGGRFGGHRKIELTQATVTRTRAAIGVAAGSPFIQGLSEVDQSTS